MPRRFFSATLHLLLALLVEHALVWGAEAPAEYFGPESLADDGLPPTAANDVVQDADGFLWVATPEELARFDGVQFKECTSPLIAKGAARNIGAFATMGNGSVLMAPAVGGLVELQEDRFVDKD